MQEQVTNVEQKTSKAGKTYYTVMTNAGKRSFWGNPPPGVGQTIEAVVEQKGDFWNLLSWKPIAMAQVVVPPVPKAAPIAERDPQRASIEKQVGVKELGECIRQGIPVPPELARGYWRQLGRMIDVVLTEAQIHAVVPADLPGGNQPTDDLFPPDVPPTEPTPKSETFTGAESAVGAPADHIIPKSVDSLFARAKEERGLTEMQVLVLAKSKLRTGISDLMVPAIWEKVMAQPRQKGAK